MTNIEQWQHIPGLTARDADPTASEADTHNLTPGATCFGCWCYACGGRTDQPRLREHGNQSPDLPDPDNHRWCFE